jgi:transposase InsO family protein
MTLGLYGQLPTGRGGVKYLLVSLDVFSKHVALYHLKAATTRGYLNKVKTHYFPEIAAPETVLSDHGSQFSSASRSIALLELGIQTRYSPVRYPESYPTELVMREFGKYEYFKVSCHTKQKKLPELVPFIGKWLNVPDSRTGYAPIELLNGSSRPDIFRNILKKDPHKLPAQEPLADKLLKAYARMK